MKAPQHTVQAECSSCGAIQLTGGGTPIGWSALPQQGMAWCTDCTAAGIPAREMRPARRQKARAA